MSLNTLGLVAGIAVARREGVAPDQVARVALPGAIFPNLALGVILVDRLAKQEASAEAVAAAGVVTGGGTTGGGTTGGGTTGGGTTGGGIPGDALPVEPASYPTVAISPPDVTFNVHDTVTVNPGRWLNLADPTKQPELAFQWFRAHPDHLQDRHEIGNAAESTYKIREKDAGMELTADVSYIDEKSGGARVTVTSPPITVAGEPTPYEGVSDRAGASPDAEAEAKSGTEESTAGV
jgi:hypothetical protein